MVPRDVRCGELVDLERVFERTFDVEGVLLEVRA